MSEIREKALNKIVNILGEMDALHKKDYWDYAEEILSTPELAVVDREANREFYDEGHQVEVEVPEGWVKEIK